MPGPPPPLHGAPTLRAPVLLLLLALAAPGCAGSPPAGRPGPAAGASSPPASPGEEGEGRPAPPGGNRGKDAPEGKGKEAFVPPERLAAGDRWFVAIRPRTGGGPFAERHRRVRGADGVLREEVVWGPGFEAVAAAKHGVMQTYALLLDARGLQVDALDGEGNPFGMPVVEVAAPYGPGTSWIATRDRAQDLVGTVVGVEAVETPGGKVEGALRVEVRSRNRWRPSLVTWYDRGLRPVRAEIRDAEGSLLEARAALPDGDPSPEQAAAALAWARKHLPR